MKLEEFDYVLPREAVAQAPAPSRDAARLLLIDRARQTFTDHLFIELPELLMAGDCLVVNDSRVIPARILAGDAMGRPVELLFVAPVTENRWHALVKPGRRCPVGAQLTAGGESQIRLGIVATTAEGTRLVESLDGTIDALLQAHGLPPLPPYIVRHAKPEAEDWDRYQTIYARTPGSVAAPTAGLHFSEAVLAALTSRGVERRALTLHVGPATFQPIRSGRVEDHVLGSERVEVPAPTAAAVNQAKAGGRRVVAVGTTTTRALEGLADASGRVAAREGSVELFIMPGYRFRVVDALLTNFHLPRSSLLVLVAAFAGRELILAAYQHAVAAGYRFYSYGDATLIV